MRKQIEKINKMVEELCTPMGVCSGMGVCFGNKEKVITKCIGTDGKGACIDSDTIFDLASLTKLFLSIVYQRLIENQVISLDNTVADYTNRYPFIGNIKLRHLLSFNVELITDRRIDSCSNRSEAIDVLYGIKGYYSEIPTYSDMPSMVLGELLGEITGKYLGEWVDELIVRPLGLKSTIWRDIDLVHFKEKICSYDSEMWLVNGSLCKKNNPLGVVNDNKSRILGDGGKILCGNAGLFSTMNDLATISKALLNESVITKSSMINIAKGNGWDVRGKNQSYGYQCYRKDSNPVQTEVPIKASKYAISSVGFTGMYWLIDTEKECFVIIAGNKLHDCISKIIPDNDSFGNKIVFEGNSYNCSVNYVYQRDILRDSIYELLCVIEK